MESFTRTMHNKIHYLKATIIRGLAKSHGKRVSRAFLHALDQYVEAKIIAACQTHNGGLKTLDAGLAHYLFVGGLKKKTK